MIQSRPNMWPFRWQLPFIHSLSPTHRFCNTWHCLFVHSVSSQVLSPGGQGQCHMCVPSTTMLWMWQGADAKKCSIDRERRAGKGRSHGWKRQLSTLPPFLQLLLMTQLWHAFRTVSTFWNYHQCLHKTELFKWTKKSVFLPITQNLGVRCFSVGSVKYINSLLIKRSPIWTDTITKNQKNENRKNIANFSVKKNQ